jgi:hypothetical protein
LFLKTRIHKEANREETKKRNKIVLAWRRGEERAPTESCTV